MDLRGAHDSESRLATYVEGLASVIGHAARVKPLRDYCVGLLMPCERKSVEPMAAVTAPARVSAQHQSLLHFVGKGGWSEEKMLAKVRELVLPEMERHGPIEAWIIKTKLEIALEQLRWIRATQLPADCAPAARRRKRRCARLRAPHSSWNDNAVKIA